MSRTFGITEPSIFTRPKGLSFYAKWRGPDGKQYCRSTGVPVASGSQAEAKQIALAWQRMTNGKAGFETAGQARRATDDLIMQLFPDARLTIERLLADWISDSRRAGKTESTLKVYKRAINHLTEFLGARIKKPVGTLTQKDATRFALFLKDAGQSDSTIKNLITLLSGPFAPLASAGIIARNPFDRKALGVRLDTVAVEKEPFTLEEVNQMLDFTKGTEWHGLILFAFYSGQRLSDAASLQWNQVDLQNRIIRVRPTKGKKSKKTIPLPVPDELHDWLMDNAGDSVGPVFPDLASKLGRLSDLFRDTVMIPAGVQFQTEVTKAGRHLNSKSFHSTRHATMTELQSLDVSDATRAGFSGHTSKAMLDRYSHARQSQMRRGVEALEKARKEAAQ
ncbi:MAG: tyrosine-type recombinase/integrase [Opitutales bacterium]|nr:tyrosine-type recombinase/integrase [Opitutales bacterium]